MKFPVLYDYSGDLTKKWYVEYFYRVPGEKEPRRYRIAKGLCTGTAAERYAQANKIIQQVTAMLKSPNLLQSQPTSVEDVMRSDTIIRPEADRYADYKSAISSSNLIHSFINYLEGSIAQKTHATYRSKLRIFAEWCDEHNFYVTMVTQPNIILFCQYLANARKLTKRSIGKYKQILHSFYDWVVKQGHCTLNPVYDIPNYGTIVDQAPAPMSKNDVERLRAAIKDSDPYLWLACMIQYYCAIRPGTELRLLQVRDIDVENRTITVRPELAKNRHKATVPINDAIVAQVDRLGIKNYAPDMYVFGSRNYPSSTPVGKNTLRMRFNHYRDQLGIDPAIKFYSWKHTGAISMVNNGVSVWELQHHMRHSSVSTTEEYLRQRANQSSQAKKFIDEI